MENLPGGFKECMQYGMLCYVVPLEVFPDTYNGKAAGIAALASQKNYMSLYLMSVYSDKETTKWFLQEYKKTGKKLDIGKSCIRFKKIEDLPLDLIGKTIARTSVEKFITQYKTARKK